MKTKDTPQPHKLYRIPVTVSFEIYVAAPSAELAVAPAVADSSVEYLQNDIQNLIGESSPASVFRFGDPVQLTKRSDVPGDVLTVFPYFNPKAPMDNDAYCEEFLTDDRG
jgi:hypothetical protein